MADPYLHTNSGFMADPYLHTNSGYIDIGLLSWPAARGPVGPRLAITICLFFEISLFHFPTFSQTGLTM